VPHHFLSDILEHHVSGHFVSLPLPATRRADPADHLLVWVVQGELTGRAGQQAIHAVAGDLVVFAPHVPHSYHPPSTGDWQWWWVHLGGSGAEAVAGQLTGGVPSVRLGRDERIRTRFAELVSAAQTVGPSLRLDSCLASLIGLMDDRLQEARRLGLDADDMEAGMTTVLDWISEHLGDRIELARLASVGSVSRATVSRMFHDHLGTSPMAYVAHQRMRRARVLLDETDLTVAQIGRAVGFADPYHFSRRFAAVVGRPPTSYRGR
jgi:AraC family transcriptional regulator, arabinose operon regulatory protein